MFAPPGHAWLCFFNPNQTGCRAYLEQNGMSQQGRSWNFVRMSALDHPNIDAELKGQPPPVPNAARLDWFERILRKNSQPVGCPLDDPQKLALPTDLVWPPT
jgi:hypothetical protein